jgi:hypothetical protein
MKKRMLLKKRERTPSIQNDTDLQNQRNFEYITNVNYSP